MGTIFYLARPDNKTLFDLGKGLVNDAFDHLYDETPHVIEHTLESLTAAILEAMMAYHNRDAAAILASYPEYVARRVLEWADGKPVLFGTEHTDGWWEWKVTSDRYGTDQEIMHSDHVAHVLEKISLAWRRHPSYRLGQLLAVAIGGDIFYTTDETLLHRLRPYACPDCIDEPCIEHVRL